MKEYMKKYIKNFILVWGIALILIIYMTALIVPVWVIIYSSLSAGQQIFLASFWILTMISIVVAWAETDEDKNKEDNSNE